MLIKKICLILGTLGLLGGCVVVEDPSYVPPPPRYASFHSHYHYLHHDDMPPPPRRPRPAFDGRPSDYPGAKQPVRQRRVVPGRTMPPTVR